MNRIVLLLLIAVAPNAYGQKARRGLELGLKAHTLTVDGRERTYRVVVPPGVRERMPLVFLLHGGSSGELAAQRVIAYAQFNRVALREKFIVAYPMGVEGNWNDGRGDTSISAHQQNVDDVKFIRAVVEEIAKSHPVDRSRIFSTGISNGAFMSHRLAAEASDLVAAVAPVVGGMGPEIAEGFAPKHPVSVLIIQGDSDPLVPIDGGAVGLGRGTNRGRTIKTTDVVDAYLKRNRIKGTPTVSMHADTDPNDGTTTQITVYPDGAGGSKVHLYVVNNGGHTWPGKRQYLPESLIGKTSKDFDATELIWEFFQSCPPRRATSR